MSNDKIVIVMSERRPITIDKKAWPRVAGADWFSGQHECQANEKAYIRVRKHADGRAIVYASLHSGPGGVPHGWQGVEAGFLLESGHDDEELVNAIRRCAGIIGRLGNECIASLPAEEL